MLLALLMTLALWPGVASAHKATIVDLGTLGGTSSQAFAIDDRLQVVGESETAGDAATHAFVWRFGRMRDLGTLGGPDSSARDINARGMIIGSADTGPEFSPEDRRPQTRAVIWSKGRARALPLPPEPWFPCDPQFGPPPIMFGEGLNDAGHATGRFVTCSTDSNAYYFDGRRTIPLPPNAPAASGWDVNDHDQVVGSVLFGQAWLYDGRSGAFRELGSLAGASGQSSAADINDAGVVVGSSATESGENHAFRYEGGIMRDLGTLGGTFSLAEAINECDWIVGSSSTGPQAAPPDAPHAFAVGPDGRMIDLNDRIRSRAGWVLDTATDINSFGVIVGYGTHHGRQRGFLLADREIVRSHLKGDCH